MAKKFSAATAVGRLEFEGLAEYGIPDGVVPEPSEDTVNEWQAAIYQSMIDGKLDLPKDARVADMAEAALNRDDRTIAENVVDGYAKLCGGTPPAKARPVPPTKPRAEDGKAPTKAALTKYATDETKYRTDLKAWCAAWEGGTPTRAQLHDLPFRPQTAFFGWLSGEFMSPERAPAATES